MSRPHNGGDTPRDDEPVAPEGKRYWLDEPRNVQRIFWALCAFCLLLAVADFFYHKHSHFEVEDFPAFYGLYGFVSFVFIVFAGKLLRKIVMRDEDYYDR